MPYAISAVECRLLAVGRTVREIDALVQNGDWEPKFLAVEPLELLPRRRLWQFEADSVPRSFILGLSRQHPRLTFVLIYDTGRLLGMIRARKGALLQHELPYRP